MNAEKLAYLIDAHDRLVSLNTGWARFAESNQASGLSTNVLGQSLWRYVHGRETKHVYEILLRRARNDYRCLNFPFRCDAPTKRRHLSMEMCPHPDGAVEFVSTLLREETRSHLALLDPTLERDETFVKTCSWCKKVQASQWVEVEAAISEIGLFDRPRLSQMSHGMCPDCLWLFKTLLGPKRPVA